MEEQKKPEVREDKKNHSRPRRHGYFIQPASESDKAAPNQIKINPAKQESPAEKREGAQGGERKEHQSHHKKKHHNNHRGNRQQNQGGAGASEGAKQPTAAENKQQKPAQNGKQTAKKTQSREKDEQRQQQSALGGNHQHKKNKHHKGSNHQKNRDAQDKSAAPEIKNTAEEKNDSAPAEAQVSKRKMTADVFTPPRPAASINTEDYEEYRLAFDDDGATSDGETAEPEKTEVVGIRFKSTGKIYYFDPAGKTYSKGSHAIVDTARGQEFGEVAMSNGFVNSSDIVPPLREVIRAANDADVAHHKENKAKEEEAFRICAEKIAAHKLDMKLIEAQYTFDNTKLLFYFTSSDRVDFRNLVKDLASVFRTRIELRQIGIRDEAKLIGGLGMCGRPLCCTLFLSDFDQVSIKMAKEQNLSLNSAKISGICGRLMCCLRYEHEAYEYEIKRTPPVDSLVRTENGDGIVTETSPLRGMIKVRLLASPEVPPKSYHRDEVTMLRKKQNKE